MTTATAEPIAELNVHTGHVKIANVTPELDAALHQWHDQANKVLRTLRGPSFLLHAVREDSGCTDDHRLDTALVTTEQCIAMLEKLEDELGSAARGHWLAADRPDSASETETTRESPPDGAQLTGDHQSPAPA